LSAAVIGAGWAGLAAAVCLCERGVPVTVFEAARQAGGRARRVTLDGMGLDNGQHILIGAYRTTLQLMRKVGADPGPLMLRLPLELRYADGFALRTPRLPYPVNLVAALVRARGLSSRDAWRAARFLNTLRSAAFRVAPDRPASTWLAEHGQEGQPLDRLWGPLCVSALNTPAHQASARVFANVLRDALTGARDNSDLLMPRADLSRLFPEPAADFVRARGGSMELGTAVRRLARTPQGFRIDERPAAYTSVIVATAPQHAAALLEPFDALAGIRSTLGSFAYEPITTCYLQYAESARLPAPMLGFNDGLLQWVFDRGRLEGPAGLLAAVISASGAHSLSNETLAARVHEQLSHSFPEFGAPRWSRVIAERRATFSCRPGLARPPMATPVPGLVLCGDYLDPEYPGTLETAVRSGVKAAEIVGV
jgi:squalene-associated FAD-dependent desaturase